LDMLVPIVESIRRAEEGFTAFDVHLGQMVFVQVVVHFLTGDNPMLDKLAMVTSTTSCRQCDGNTRSHLLGKVRVESETLKTQASCSPQVAMTTYGISADFSPMAALLTLRVHSDFALDYLHNVSHGLVKRFLALVSSSLSKGLHDAYVAAVDAFPFDMAGLKRYSGVRLLKYHGSFEAHDFKMVVQFLPFVLLELVEVHLPNDPFAQKLLQASIALSRVGAHLWRIRTMRADIPVLRRLIVDTVQLLYDLEAGFRHTEKAHMLVHVPDSIIYLGTQRAQVTEMFEARNKDIRHRMVHMSNHREPSRDLAVYYGILYSYGLMINGIEWSPTGERMTYGNNLKCFLKGNRTLLTATITQDDAPNDHDGGDWSHLNAPGRPRYRINGSSPRAYRAVIAQDGTKVHLDQAFVSADRQDGIVILERVTDGDISAIQLKKACLHTTTEIPIYGVATPALVQLGHDTVLRAVSLVPYKAPGKVGLQYFLNIFKHDSYACMS